LPSPSPLFISSAASDVFKCQFEISAVFYESSPQSCVKVQPHQKHNVLRCEPNCHAFLSEERGQEQ
ncbi:hypothetical protein FVD66_14825, partial [Enterococcus faecium]|nr:hypothetical protein [Enterococcus faecium]